jgi:hypothetical protein|tara:strand:+ start:58 stop:270 length:213 start_codon:yes stop_codon:yes gene_type:complete
MLVYCDYIADSIQIMLRREINDFEDTTILETVEGVKMDLHPTEGYFVSTKKTMKVTDKNGRAYLVTVEEL